MTEELKEDHAQLRIDAARYRWLREQHWSKDTLTVAKPSDVKLGSMTYSEDWLDMVVDDAMKEFK